MKLIHVTDPHLVAPGATLYGLDPEQRFAAFVDSVNAENADADLCLVTGDLADLGAAAAYGALRRHLDRLTVPWHLLIGNHDNRAIYRQAFPEAPVDGDGFMQQALTVGGQTLLMLDTNEPGIADGRYCARRCRWLADRLAAVSGPVMIAMHHPPFDVGIPRLDRIGLQDQAAFADVVLPHAGRIRHIFFGHLHRPVSGSWHGIAFSTLRATAHQTVLHFDTRDVIPGCHEPPSYAVVLIHDDSVIVHGHDYMDRSMQFDLVKYDSKAWATLKA